MFNNLDVSIEQLPTIEDRNFNGLNPKYKVVMMINASLFVIIMLIGFSIFYFVVEDEFSFLIWPILTGVLVLSIPIMLTTYLGFAKKQYKLREKDIVFRKGLFWKSETSVPFVRVQHSEVVEGPINRMFGLAKLKLYTAGGQTSDLSIPGLDPGLAQSLKDYISNRVLNDEEE